MFLLALVLHVFIGSTLGGSAVIAFLVLGLDSWQMLLAAAVGGFLLAFPVSYVIAKKLYA
jgi:hypothetical protein